jgi:hypothetical protein
VGILVLLLMTNRAQCQFGNIFEVRILLLTSILKKNQPVGKAHGALIAGPPMVLSPPLPL